MMDPSPLSPQLSVRQRQWCVDGFPVLTLRLSLPSFAGDDRRLRRIERCYARFGRCYERYCARFLLPRAAEAFRLAAAANRPFALWEAEGSFRVTLLTPQLLSLTLDTAEPDFEAAFRRRRGDTWDLRDGLPLALSDFFPDDPFPLRRGRAAARAALTDQIDELRPDWRLRLRTAAKGEHFYLTAEGLVFFYPMYALGGAALGIPEFLLPWGDGGAPVLSAGCCLPPLDKGEDGGLS